MSIGRVAVARSGLRASGRRAVVSVGWLCVAGMVACNPESGADVVSSRPVAGDAPRGDAPWSRDELERLFATALPDALPPDTSNRFSDDPRAITLGRQLFYDPGLSGSGVFSCATCHAPELHFTDGKPKSIAAGTTARHAPTIEGAQLGPWFFWDGRADSLWAQAAGPIEHPHEMDGDRLSVVRYVAGRYREQLRELSPTFPTVASLASLPTRARPDAGAVVTEAGAAWSALPAAERDRITGAFVDVLKSIAAFERTVIPAPSAFDRYVDQLRATGGEHARIAEPALDAKELAGLRLFMREGACISCHHGPMLSDRAFHNLGLPLVGGFDGGRTDGAQKVRTSEFRCGSAWSDQQVCAELKYLNPEFPDFIAAFKTPTLRNVTRTAPYMHNGDFASLDAVLGFYSDLPGDPIAGHRELTLKPLKLDVAQREALKAFLRTLEAPVPASALPPAG